MFGTSPEPVWVTQSNKWPACWPVTFAPHETEELPKMSLSKYIIRRGQFEVLEAEQLFAAGLMEGVATGLPDTAIVDGFGSLSSASIGLVNASLGGQEDEDIAQQLTGTIAPVNAGAQRAESKYGETNGLDAGDLGAEINPGDLVSVDEMNPGDRAVELSARVFYYHGGFSYAENLSGQEGEPLTGNRDVFFSHHANVDKIW